MDKVNPNGREVRHNRSEKIKIIINSYIHFLCSRSVTAMERRESSMNMNRPFGRIKKNEKFFGRHRDFSEILDEDCGALSHPKKKL